MLRVVNSGFIKGRNGIRSNPSGMRVREQMGNCPVFGLELKCGKEFQATWGSKVSLLPSQEPVGAMHFLGCNYSSPRSLEDSTDFIEFC